MQLSESLIETQRRRLPGQTESVIKSTGIGGLAAFMLGILTILFGTVVTLIGLKIIPYAPSDIYAPYWVLVTFGGIFVFAGLTLWIQVLLEYLFQRRCRNKATKHPRSAAYADYPWNPKGMMKSPWSQVARSFFPITVFAIFLAPFNWWASRSDISSLLIICIVALFDLGFLLGVVELIRRLLAALKYGKSGIEYGRFPLFTDKSVDLRWLVPSGLEQAEKITFTLRCVEEFFEWSGSGEDRRKDLVHEQLWATTRSTIGKFTNRVNSRIPLKFEIPATVPGSYLSPGERITFW